MQILTRPKCLPEHDMNKPDKIHDAGELAYVLWLGYKGGDTYISRSLKTLGYDTRLSAGKVIHPFVVGVITADF